LHVSSLQLLCNWLGISDEQFVSLQ
jgi:hypothetical protein